MTKVQVCGVQSFEDAMICQDAGVDAIGFVHVPGRKRSVSLENTRKIIRRVSDLVISTLITFDHDAKELARKVDFVGARAVQTYNMPPAEMVKMMDQGIEVISAVSLDSRNSRPDIGPARMSIMASVADTILFEPSVNGVAGGLGVKMDLVRLGILTSQCKRFGIAGGLNPGNVGTALRLDPDRVDVSSGVEGPKGTKDPKLVQDFVSRCRR